MKLYRSKIEKLAAVSPQDIRVAVYGLGKMGLPLAAVFASKGFQVLGVDTNEEVVKKVNAGVSPVVEEAGLEKLVQKVVKGGKFKATSDGALASRETDIKIIIVPTFLDEKNHPDLEIVKKVTEKIALGLQKGDLVILESTAPPGTTLEVIAKILEKKSGLRLGRDFAVAHCPERTNSGTAIADIQGRINPKVVGACDNESLKIVKYLYGLINKRGVIPVKDTTTAELVKISEMVYRDVKIAYANSLAVICSQLKIDALEVIRAANTDAGCDILDPGPGVGGHCIPVYPYFIFDKVKKGTELLQAARLVNDGMSTLVIDLAKRALSDQGRDLKKSTMLILGFAYRGGVKETRLSPGIKIYKELQGKAARVLAYDPLFSRAETEALGMEFFDSFRGVDCILITADHKEFSLIEWKKAGQEMRTKAVVDGKFILKKEAIESLGFSVKSIGYEK